MSLKEHLTHINRDFIFDLISEKFFDSYSIDTANFDLIDPGLSWEASLAKFISYVNNKLSILHLNINSVLGLGKRFGLDSILAWQKFD